MSLREYQAPKVTIDLGEGNPKLIVCGLTLEAVTILINEHLSDLEAVFDLVVDEEATLTRGDFDTLVSALLSQAPGLAANIIAVAANEPDAAPQIATMPFMVQANALMQIANLTFKEVGSVKKSLEQIAALRGVNMKAMLTKAKELKDTKVV